MSSLADSAPLKEPVGGLAAGQTVGAGRYLLKKILGQGGMAVVWLAEDKLLHDQVALKFLPPQLCFDPAAMDGLRRETLRTRKLSHPNIIRLHDLHDVPDEPVFISMEYVDGPNLHTLRANCSGKVLTWDFLAPVVRQLISALDYAHNEKIIHRDLKPANLMLDSSGKLKLSDFGLAGIVTDSMSRLSETAHTSGTIGYMSPQQADGKKPRITDDIYALGVTLYELLTSTPPFYSGDIGYQIRNVAPDPMAQRLADLELSNTIPDPVAATVMACLAKEPAQRPQNARAVLEGIDGAEGPTPPANGAAVARPASARKLVPLGSALVLAMALSATFVFWAVRSPPRNSGDAFRSIFNGRDLSGWDGDPSFWAVKGGAITASSAAEGVKRRENTCLIWRQNVDDFELRLLFRTLDVIAEKPANSGVLYRSRRVRNPEHNWQVRGYQCEIYGELTGTLILLEDSARDVRSEWGRGALLGGSNDQITITSTAPTTTNRVNNVIKPGAWNELVIIARGNHLVHKINGVVTFEGMDKTAAPVSGCLALELKRATQIEFKDIGIRRLRPLGDR
jgi:serine/threonine protein kinase